jgi:hypothetical protein
MEDSAQNKAALKQPWKAWYRSLTQVEPGAYFVWPSLIAGNGPGNGADQVLSLGIDLDQPKPRPQPETEVKKQ